MKNTNKYSFDTIIRSREISPNGILSPLAIIELMQEASMQHVSALKISFWDLEERGLTWVLLKKDIKIYGKAYFGNKITIDTYPTEFKKVFAYRDYKIYHNNELIAEASSQWVLMDLKTRKLREIPIDLRELMNQSVSSIDSLEKPLSKLPIVSISECSDSFEAMWLDQDWNGHTNNLFLVKCFLNTHQKLARDNQAISRMIFHFKKEVLIHEEINCFADIITNGTIMSLARKDQEIARAQFIIE